MSDLPKAVFDYFWNLTYTSINPAYLKVDGKKRLLAWGGDLPAYGISTGDDQRPIGLDGDETVTDLLPYLEFEFPTTEEATVLPFIEILPGRYATVHIFPDTGHYWILLLDQTAEATQQQSIRQKANELNLLQIKNLQLIDKLELTNKMLTESVAEVHAKNQILQDLAEKRDEFFNVLMHDMRSPLASFQMLLDGMKTGVLGVLNSRQLGLLDKMNDAVKKQIDQVNELLESARHEISDLDLHPEAASPAELLRAAGEEYRMAASRKNITFRLEIPENLPTCEMDQEKIRRVVANYLSNAVKYTERGGEIILSAQYAPEEKRLIVAVRDNGVGIDREDIPHLFQKYQRAHNNPTEGEKSMGLGLYICRQIVEAHGGHTAVQSAVGHGSTFSFTLPYPRPGG